jgi:tripartite-type tricarboxylate transporter receptor subunit TctC
MRSLARSRRAFLALAGGLAVLGAGLASAQAPAFPSRPITLVVPFPPGGSTDRAIRLIGQRLSESVGQPVIVENKAGGNGVIGALAVKQAAPDGHTLFVGHAATHAINVTLYDKLPYDPVKDFRPITTFMSFPSLVVVPADSPAKTMAELVALSRSRPGGLSYSSQGIGTPGHLLGAMLQAQTGGTFVHIPMKGAAAATTEVVAGRVDLLFSSYGTAAPFVRDNRLRMLAIASTQRSPKAPDLPTMAEAGFPGIELDFWFGVFAPAGTPDAVIQRLNRELIQAVRSPEVTNALTAEGVQIITSTPDAFAALIAQDTVRLGKIVRDAGAKAE